MPAVSAGFGEILRAAQKDEAVLKMLTYEVSTNFLLKIIGPRKWLLWKPLIEASTKFAYLALTTLSDCQTLGEEYTGILQVRMSDESGRLELPSKLRRLIMVFLQSFGHLALKLITDPVLKTLSKSDNRKFVLEVLLEFCEFASKFNAMWFFIRGGFYHLSKRVTNVHYVKLRKSEAQPEDIISKLIRISYLMNGAILVYKLASALKKKWLENAKKDEQLLCTAISDTVDTSGKKCPLCLDVRKNATSTVCGHIFCWTCIHECVSSTEECPICREALSPSRLIPLMNYS